MQLATTAVLFVATAIAEIIGCYLPYLWLLHGRSRWLNKIVFGGDRRAECTDNGNGHIRRRWGYIDGGIKSIRGKVEICRRLHRANGRQTQRRVEKHGFYLRIPFHSEWQNAIASTALHVLSNRSRRSSK